MKKCNFCGEEIQDSAKKCRFCGEWLDIKSEKIDINNKINEATIDISGNKSSSDKAWRFILGPVISFIGIFLLYSIVNFIIVSVYPETSIQNLNLVGKLMGFIGLVFVLLIVPCLIYGIVLLKNDRIDNSGQRFKVKRDKWFYFNANGRIGRLEYFAIQLLSLIIGTFLIGFLAVFSRLMGINLNNNVGFYFVVFIFGSIYLWVNIMIRIKRLHDLDNSGWLLIIALIPVVSFFFGIYILFFRGTKGINRFGEEPI